VGQEGKLAEQQKGETSFYRASAAADPPAQRDTETTMNASQSMKPDNTIERQLQSVQMSQHVRDQVLQDARIAQLIVDAIVWVGGRFERLNDGALAKASPK
jgi:hypothetical protein